MLAHELRISPVPKMCTFCVWECERSTSIPSVEVQVQLEFSDASTGNSKKKSWISSWIHVTVVCTKNSISCTLRTAICVREGKKFWPKTITINLPKYLESPSLDDWSRAHTMPHCGLIGMRAGMSAKYVMFTAKYTAAISRKVHTLSLFLFLPIDFGISSYEIFDICQAATRTHTHLQRDRAKIETFFQWINKYANHLCDQRRSKNRKVVQTKQKEKSNNNFSFVRSLGRFHFFSLLSGCLLDVIFYVLQNESTSLKSKWRKKKTSIVYVWCICATRFRVRFASTRPPAERLTMKWKKKMWFFFTSRQKTNSPLIHTHVSPLFYYFSVSGFSDRRVKSKSKALASKNERKQIFLGK